MTGFAIDLVIKDLERRWGLALVSFAPPETATQVRGVQELVRELTTPHASQPQEPTVDFYDAEQLHCTHLTLTRSSAWHPVRSSELVKPGRDGQRLCDVLAQETAGLGPIAVLLDRVDLSDNGFNLLGACADDPSAARRSQLLDHLNQRLPEDFNLSRRAWDTDKESYLNVHMRIGFVKRSFPGYDKLPEATNVVSIDPILAVFSELTLVHHRYRSLRPPHEGSATFALDGPDEADIAFAKLGLTA
jgi:hypothetical protein